MELILKEDVQNLGFKDEIVSVKNGYGRNFLIPKGIAVMATVSARKVLAENLKQRAYKEKSIIDEATKRAEKIKALDIKLASKVGSGDKLFGSISNADLASAITTKGEELDKKFITLPGKTIKRLGKYEATIRLHREVSFEFPFEIVPEAKS
ncbi:50S ribosomal protein L9 [Flavobacteriaceae bacterium]|jgi:large subunit ribosomal protein L9|nr:50S ribosomal protein L9 [Flavobacteriaceae bacterium]MDA9892956.1 50S ribosomal protein L9 [Flavobacteriaceae bacterium]MDB2342328.1 50S ribosomal protein L9 [Flavobacteriaceae bacterium]MDC0875080.1 50S ribosomal protein L9 [Flavobacteriaceae bacterium]MDC1031425.1 50S ribosomal protein L9 [Flavobacteriaceae bacterium]